MRSIANKQNDSETVKVALLTYGTESESENTYDVIAPNKYGSQGIVSQMWELSIGLIELIVLGILSSVIISDMRVIRWYEKKRKS